MLPRYIKGLEFYPWRHIAQLPGVIRVAALSAICATTPWYASAQGLPAAGATATGMASTIRKGCVVDHRKFCPTGQGGTHADVACLQQHHVSLEIKCRNLLARVAGKPATDLNTNPAAGVGP